MTAQLSHKDKLKRDFFTTIYASMKQHSKTRNHGELSFTKEEFINWFWQQNNSIFLMNNWIDSGCNKLKKPTVDRIDNSIGYEFSNMQLLTYEENHSKQTLLKSRAVEQLDNEGNVLAVFPSINTARQALGINRTGIGNAIRNGTKAGGYYWRKINTLEKVDH